MTEPLFIEVLKVKDGLFIDPQPHVERIFRTTLNIFADPLSVKLANNMIPVDLQTGVVKCRIIYGSKIVSIDFEAYEMRSIQSLALIENDNINYSYKYLNRNKINELFTMRGDSDDILIVKNSRVTDTSYSNVVFKDSDGSLYTPKSTLLPGTKRRKLLDAGIIREKEICLKDIKSYVGVYLINAMIDIEDGLFVGVDFIL